MIDPGPNDQDQPHDQSRPDEPSQSTHPPATAGVTAEGADDMATIEVTEPERSTAPGPVPADRLADGTRVEVRNRLDGTWSRGFEIAGHENDGYRLRRLSDGGVLPIGFGEADVRPERERKRGTWWY